MKQQISTPAAPAAIGPYSQAIGDGEWLFCSGQIGIDPASGRLVEGGIEHETRRVMENLGCGASPFRRYREDHYLHDRPRRLRHRKPHLRRASECALPGARDRAGRGAAAWRASGDRRHRAQALVERSRGLPSFRGGSYAAAAVSRIFCSRSRILRTAGRSSIRSLKAVYAASSFIGRFIRTPQP